MKEGTLNIPEYVRDALLNVAQKLGFTAGQHTVDYDFRANGDNRSVVSVFYRVTFREEPREATVLCKVPPPGADGTLLALFEREAFVYGKLLPAFEQFQRNSQQGDGASDTEGEAKPKEEAFGEETFAPRCYHAHCDVKKAEGIIIMEDVLRRGFSNRQKFEPMDYDHARLAMLQLGRFHALSLALKQQQPELFEQYRYMTDVTRERVLGCEGFAQTMQLAFDSAMATLNPGDGTKREKLARLGDGFVEELQTINDTTQSEPFCVVCHGDFSADNMMFSYNVGSIDEETGRVMVKFTLGGIMDWVNEYMVMLVSREEYNKHAKVLNATKYEEWKSRGQLDERRLHSPDIDRKSRQKDSQRSGRSRSPPRVREISGQGRNRISSQRESPSEGSTSDSEDRHKRKHKKASSSSNIRTSSGTKKKSHKYKQRHNDHRRHGSDSESDDRHHKKKTKKSKKPRSRSRSRR